MQDRPKTTQLAVLTAIITTAMWQRTTMADEAGTTATTGLLRVLAVDEEGSALPNVKVHASIWTKEKFAANRKYECDANGRAFVILPKTLHILRVWARAPGRVPQFVQLWSKEQSKFGLPLAEEFLFRLEKGTSIGGVVKSTEGQAIPSAKVEVMYVERGEHDPGRRGKAAVTLWLSEGEPTCITDAEGKWHLDNLPAGDDVEVKLKVTHSDFERNPVWGSLQRKQGITMRALRDRTASLLLEPNSSNP